MNAPAREVYGWVNESYLHKSKGACMDPRKPVEKVKQVANRVADAEVTKKATGFAKEFRDFAFKGNMIDLAIGVIIGAAFGKLIDSLVKTIFMPFIDLFIPGDQGYRAWSFTVNGKEFRYGEFLGELVNFLIVAFAIFLFIKKFLGWMAETKQDPPKQEQLLTEIRDLLKERSEPR